MTISINEFKPIIILQYPKMNQPYNRYKIPPNFHHTEIHSQASLIYSSKSQVIVKCPCECRRSIASKKISLCSQTDKLLRIGQQLPNFFGFVRWLFGFLGVWVFVVGGQYAFGEWQAVEFTLNVPSFEPSVIQIGYIEESRALKFVFFLLYTAGILLMRFFLKKQKKEFSKISKKVAKKTLQLTNVHQQATEEQIENLFDPQEIQSVVFTYNVEEYNDLLQKIYRMKKKQILWRQDPQKQQLLVQLNSEMRAEMAKVQMMRGSLRSHQKRMDLVFVTFTSQQQCCLYLSKYAKLLPVRVFLKLCSCCSSTSLHGQHITLTQAPEPEDLIWPHLQQSYCTRKMHRFACYLICVSLLVSGLLIQHSLQSNFSPTSQTHFYIQILQILITFIINFVIISILEYTTFNIEKHQTRTNQVLSLVKKLTFFIFVNLSMSPLSFFIYYHYFPGEREKEEVFGEFCFGVCLVFVVNIFKPFAEYFKFERVSRCISFYIQKCKGNKCTLTQQQSNLAFEPIAFPLAPFYALLLSSFFMTSFFISIFQLFIVTQVISVIFLFYIAKYMLLKVCKEPVGLSREIGQLAQRMLSYAVAFYWLGEKVMGFYFGEGGGEVEEWFVGYAFGDAYGIIQVSVVVFVLFFSSYFLSKISKVASKDSSQFNTTFLEAANYNHNQLSYQEVNSIKHIEAEYETFFKHFE